MVKKNGEHQNGEKLVKEGMKRERGEVGEVHARQRERERQRQRQTERGRERERERERRKSFKIYDKLFLDFGNVIQK